METARNSYEQKLADRKARMEDRAAKLRAAGEARYAKAKEMAAVIPFGQPIHIGHHSEKGDRAFRAKIGKTYDKAFETLKAADEVAARAASVGTGGVSSDDPDAIKKLQAEVVEREAAQTKMAAVNKALRAGDNAAVLALGVPESVLAKWNDPATSKWDKGFASFQLSNNSASIRRIKSRIEQLQSAAKREHKEISHNSGVRLVQNVEANRLQLFFPDKPDEATRKMLKASGFRWAPSENAWQRHLNNAGVYAAQNVLRQLPTGGA